MRMRHVHARCSRKAMWSAIESLERRTLLSAGDLDPTFSDGGTVAAIPVKAVAVQRDGHIVAAGSLVERFEPDGSFDRTFGGQGSIDPGFTANAIAIQGDGKIVIAGGTGAVARYNPDGTPDRTFGTFGATQSPVPLDPQTISLALAPDGKVVEGGLLPTKNVFEGYAAAVRFDQNGKIDTSFDGSGYALRPISSIFNSVFSAAVTVQQDGKVLLGAEFGFDQAVFRFNVDGSIDQSFGLNGLASTNRGAGDITTDNYDDVGISQIVVQPDGKVITAGPIDVSSDAFFSWQITRFNPDGSVDTSFGNQGNILVSGLGRSAFGPQSLYAPGGLLLQSNGDILIGGSTISDDSPYTMYQHLGPFVVKRYLPDGTPDPSFHTQPITSSYFQPTYGTGGAMALAPDGKIVIAGGIVPPGQFNPPTAGLVARLQNDPPVPFASPFPGHPFTAGRDTIEAENFDTGGEGVGDHTPTPQNQAGVYRDAGVAITADASASNGYYVGPTVSGGWLQYTTFVPVAGTYQLAARAASAAAGGAFHATIDGRDFTGAIAVPDTGGADVWQTVSSHPFDLSIGSHVLRVYFDSAGSFDSFALNRTAVPVPPPGTPDLTFGLQGRQLYGDPTLDSSVQHHVRAVAVQTDGKIVLAGSVGAQANQGAGEIYLQRLNKDGTVDTTFGTNGAVETAVGPVSFATAILLQSDGKILVGGATEDKASAPSNASFILLRYNADGSIDKTFGMDGIEVTDFPGNEEIDSLSFAPGGKIVAAGASFVFPDVGFDVARYNADGSIDKAFNGSGTLSKNLGPTGQNSGPVGLAVQNDGKIVIGAHQGDLMALYRYNADGSPDSGFGGTGVATATGNSGLSYSGLTGNKVVIQPDGKLLLGGSGAGLNVVVRFNPDGSRDGSFNVTPQSPSGDLLLDAISPVAGLLLEADGRVVLASAAVYHIGPYGATTFSVASVPPTGAPTGSQPFLATSPFEQDVAEAAALAPDGNVVIAGDVYAYSDPADSPHWIGVARYSFAPGNLVPGDANGDGEVNFVDLLAVAQNYATAGAVRSQGDLNTDGLVNFSDLLLMVQNYGKSIAAPAAAVSAPSTAVRTPAAAVSAAPLMISGSSGDDAITVATGPGNTLVATVNGTTSTYTADQYAGGITIDTGNATGTGDTLTIDGLPAVAATVKGEGALAVTVGVDGFGERGTRDIAASPLTIEGGPAGTTKLTIDDSSDSTPRAVTLDAFTADGSTYGSIQGLAPAPINFNGANMASVSVSAGRNTVNAVTVNNTPGGGRIFIANLASAVVLGTAPGQLLDLLRTFGPDVRVEMTVDFSTGRIGTNSFINADTKTLNVRGRSPTDAFSGAGFIHEADGVKVGYDDLDIDTIHLSNGTYQAFNFQQPIISLNLGPDATMTLTGPYNLFNGLSVGSSSSLTLLPNPWGGNPTYGLNVFGSLSVAGKLDLMNNDLETLTPLDQIRSLVLQGLGGTSGITSSRADASHNLGYGPIHRTFGETAQVRYTLYGDANLDGKVDFSDLLALAQNYGKSGAFWFQGDFNYDGKVVFADLLRLTQNYGRSLDTQAVGGRRRQR